jgi:hypothetical protein
LENLLGPSGHHLAFSSPTTPASSRRQPLNVRGDSADDKDQPQRQPEVERLYRTYREQLFRFLWRVKPWSNAETAASAATTTLTEPYENAGFFDQRTDANLEIQVVYKTAALPRSFRV